MSACTSPIKLHPDDVVKKVFFDLGSKHRVIYFNLRNFLAVNVVYI